LLLVPLLLTHVPNAMRNLTMIEENYDNMPNPFEQGTSARNLAQVFGSYGIDWLLPILPRKPVSDGVSYARTDEILGPDGLPEPVEDCYAPGGFQSLENVWKQRYHVKMDPKDMEADSGPLSTMSRWLTG